MLGAAVNRCQLADALRAELEVPPGLTESDAELQGYLREQANKTDEAKLRTDMTDQPSRPARDGARIPEIPEAASPVSREPRFPLSPPPEASP